jgi:two-component system chemotaxis sensor kinase CheA
MPVTEEAVTIILATIDRVKEILDTLEQQQQEPAGTDDDLISQLDRMVVQGLAAASAAPAPASVAARRPQAAGHSAIKFWNARSSPARFRSTIWNAPSAIRPDRTPHCPRAPRRPGNPTQRRPQMRSDDKNESKVANQSIRVNVDTLKS